MSRHAIVQPKETLFAMTTIIDLFRDTDECVELNISRRTLRR